MENTIKYTTDGKKVKVLGKLNSVEYIVQEIFIIDGQEIPSGENFTTKSLYDNLAKPWKEEYLEDLEERFESEKRRIEKRLKELKTTSNKQIIEVRKKTEFLKKFVDNVSESAFDRVTDFLTGKIKYMVKLNYEPKIIKFNIYDNYCRDIKLITLFGKDNGTLDWRLNDYNDGSGSNTPFIPCKSLDEAKGIITLRLNSQKSLNAYEIKAVEKWDLQVNQSLIDNYHTKGRQEILDQIEEYETKVKVLKTKIK